MKKRRAWRRFRFGVSPPTAASITAVAAVTSLTCAGLNLEVRKPDIQWFCMDRATRNVRIGRTEDEVRLPSGNQQLFRFIEPKGFTTAQDKPAGKPNVYRLRPPTNSDVFLYSITPCQKI